VHCSRVILPMLLSFGPVTKMYFRVETTTDPPGWQQRPEKQALASWVNKPQSMVDVLNQKHSCILSRGNKIGLHPMNRCGTEECGDIQV